MKSFREIGIVLLALLPALFISCTPVTDNDDVIVSDLDGLRFGATPDTIFMRSQGQQRLLTLIGWTTNIVEYKYENTGLVAYGSIVTSRVETTFTTVDNAYWYSSNQSVATVSGGILTSGKPGYATISATARNATTPQIAVKVIPPSEPPGLILATQETTLVFEQRCTIAGSAQIGSLVSIVDSASNLTTSVLLDEYGNFVASPAGNVQGDWTLAVVATQPGRPDLATTRHHHVTCYPYGHAALQPMLQRWTGEAGGESLRVIITDDKSYQALFIRANIDITLQGIGLVRGLQAEGYIQPDGNFSIPFVNNRTDYEISGALSGRFFSTSQCRGTLDVSVTSMGWLKSAAKRPWSAHR